MRSIAAFFACAALLGACGSDTGSPATDGGGSGTDGSDGGPVFRCWPTIDPIPRGTVELGKGGTAFSPMPETLPLEYGFQGGFMVKVWTRMSGFTPGDGELLSDNNPFTRVRATFADFPEPLQLPGDCAFRGNYVPNDVGSYDYVQEIAAIFNICWGTDRLVGARLKIDVELMDNTGSYATDSRIITATESLDPTYHNIPTSDGCGL